MHPGGKHVAFGVTKTSALGAAVSVVHDGKVIATDEWIGPVSLDPTNGTPAYLVSGGWINNADGSLSHAPMAIHYGKAKGKKWVISSTNLAPSFPSGGGFLVCVGTKGGESSIFRVDAKGKEDRLAHDAAYPLEATGAPPISVGGLVPAQGGTRTYTIDYRDVFGCNGARFNLTDTQRIVWTP